MTDLERYGRHEEGCASERCAHFDDGECNGHAEYHGPKVDHLFQPQPCSCGFASALLANGWQPIETAPRDSSHILVFYPRLDENRQEVMEAWWDIPYEAAPNEKGLWQTMSGVLLSADVHDGLGATHWQPLPKSPKEQS